MLSVYYSTQIDEMPMNGWSPFTFGTLTGVDFMISGRSLDLTSGNLLGLDVLTIDLRLPARGLVIGTCFSWSVNSGWRKGLS